MYVVLNYAEIQTNSENVPWTFWGFSALLSSHVSDKVRSGSCLWFLWHECKLSTSDYQVTQTSLGMCAWTKVCMRTPPLSSPDATPLWLCLAVWEDLSSTASHHLSGFCSSGLYCICKIAQTQIPIYLDEHNIRRNRLYLVDWPAVEVNKCSTDRESSPTDLYSFQHPRVSQLIQNHVRIELVGIL